MIIGNEIHMNDFFNTVIMDFQSYDFYKEGKNTIVKRVYTEFTYVYTGGTGWGLIYIKSYQFYSEEDRDTAFKEIFNKKYNYLLK